MNDLETFKKQFDSYLLDYLDKKTQGLTRYTKDTPVLDYVNYAKKITIKGGKRVRPYIAYLMYRILVGKRKKKY